MSPLRHDDLRHWRDVSWVAGVLAYAVHRTGGDSAEAFTTAAELASPGVAASLAGFALEPPTDLGEWGLPRG